MGLLKNLFFLSFCLFISGCQLPYYWKSATGQVSLLSSRVPVDKAAERYSLSEDQKRKIALASQAHSFSETDLHLKKTKNYSSYVQLDRSHVSYVVSASEKWEFKPYLWDFLFVGKMPYKGFFNEADAKAEEKLMQERGFDTDLRGVSAYSTLGWFDDPLLSSMLRYKDYDLVNTIIHETVHATLYIKNSADFNERMAVFLGNKGMELFFLKIEGPDSPTLAFAKADAEDERLFADWIGQELKSLETWYQERSGSAEKTEELRTARFQQIYQNFQTELRPRLKTNSYLGFGKEPLNNAKLSVYKTYLQDLSDFETLFEKSGRDFAKFLDHCKSLEKHSKPEQGLKDLLISLP